MAETNAYEQVQTEKDLPIIVENDIENQSQKVNLYNDEIKQGETESNKPSSKAVSTSADALTRSIKAQARLESRMINHDIEWSQISFKVGEKAILSDCYGKVPACSVCAILGPSGAGKSSLLNVLAGRSATAPGYTVEGTVTVGGRIIHPVEFRQRIAYVMQDDALMPTATPREALEFSANLRLPSDTSKAEITELVSKTITDLGLDGCADVLIGGAMIKGISGGQRKRTSIGVEIITDPEILFLDEPTSGLDSFSAQSCINLFSVIAKTRHTAILCTIHQPSSEVFVLFDQVIFMKEGRIFYQGLSSELLSFFSRFGYQCPLNHNPADYVMLLSQTETMEQVEKSGIMAANQTRALAIREETSHCSNCEEVYFPDVIRASFVKQLAWLTYRELTSIRRDTTALIARFGITIFLNLIYGLIFLNAGSGDNGVNATFQAHYGAISMVTISSMFGSSQSVLLAFPFERPLFLREHSTGTYTGIAYFIGKTMLELPLTFLTTLVQFILCYFMIDMQGDFGIIVGANFALGAASCSVAVFLGCIVNDVKDATELSTLLFVPQLLFSGFFINTKLIPVFLRWAQYLCSLKYALNLVLITEFSSSQPSCSGAAASENCETVLTNNNIEPDLWWFYVLMLFLLFFVFRAIACVILIRKAKRFY